MPKGHRNGSDSDSLIFQLAARFQERILLFSAETGISADWVTTRLSELLSPPGQRVLDHLPAMRQETAGIRGTVEPLALAEHAHRGRASRTIEASAGTGQTPRRQVNNYWANKSPGERSAEMRRRMKKWKPESVAKWKGVILTKEQKQELHRAYTARAAAKKQGLPLPPIPKFGQVAKTNKAKPVQAAPKAVPKKHNLFPKASQHLNTRSVLSEREKLTKQKVYVKRSVLRAQGVPEEQLPPLPEKLATAV